MAPSSDVGSSVRLAGMALLGGVLAVQWFPALPHGLALYVSVAALAACTTPPKGGAPILLQEGKIDAAAGVLGNNGGAIISNNGGKLVANNAGSLAGNVVGPAGLIANNAASYRLKATFATAPLEGAVVTALDAAGNAVAVEQIVAEARAIVGAGPA